MADFLGLTVKMDPFGAAFQAPPPDPTARVNLSKLPSDQKRRLWEGLKQTDPALADLLRSAPLQALIHEFDASVILPKDQVREALNGHH